MTSVQANGITIEYERYGDSAAPAVLLVMGLGAQLVRWPMALVDRLVARGYQAIRYDNRDVGLSTKFDAAGTPALARLVASRWLGLPAPAIPYTLTDMAQDAVALLDALGIERAHLMGASMGGMIAQLVAARWPERTETLTSIMSSTGDPALPGMSMGATGVLLRRPRGTDIDAIVAHGVTAARVCGSPGYPFEEGELAERIRAETLRDYSPGGFVRQMAAILVDGDRTARLAAIEAPTLVVHGRDDVLVPLAAGRATAAAIRGARLLEIPGMGHTLPDPLLPVIVDAFDELVHGTADLQRAA